MDRNTIKTLLGDTVYSRALRYYERGRVHAYAETESAQLFAEADKTLSVTAFASKHHKHLYGRR